MNKIKFKNEKLINKVFKQPFAWALLTVSNEKGFYKIAIKKSLFKKTYKICYINEGKICTLKDKIAIDNLSNKSITINGNNFNIEDISFKLTNPAKSIEREERIYSKISDKTAKEYENKIKKIKDEYAKEKENDELLAARKANLYKFQKIEDAKKLRKALIPAEKSLKCWHQYGYAPGGNNENTTIYYDLEFVISEFARFSSLIGFYGFKNSCMQDILKNIKNLEQKCNRETQSLDTIINSIYALNGALARELLLLVNGLCGYIDYNNININFEYTKYDNWCNPSDCYQKFTESIIIRDEFDKLLNAVAVYIKKVTGVSLEYTNPMKLQSEQKEKIYTL